MSHEELLDRLNQLQRYDAEVCNCCLGPHVDMNEESDGTWVRFEDVLNLLNQ